jgi:hypothetical protein
MISSKLLNVPAHFRVRFAQRVARTPLRTLPPDTLTITFTWPRTRSSFSRMSDPRWNKVARKPPPERHSVSPRFGLECREGLVDSGLVVSVLNCFLRSILAPPVAHLRGRQLKIDVLRVSVDDFAFEARIIFGAREIDSDKANAFRAHAIEQVLLGNERPNRPRNDQ